jgi:hypothetical protein
MRQTDVCRVQVGRFLGKDYPVSEKTLVEFVNTSGLEDTGVISGLVRGCKGMCIPGDLQKISRITRAIARIWWKQNKKMKTTGAHKDRRSQCDDTMVTESADSNISLDNLTQAPDTDTKSKSRKQSDAPPALVAGEIAGPELMGCLPSEVALYQLMFSTILLHWYTHSGSSLDYGSVDLAAWYRINQGLVTDTSFQRVLSQIYEVVTRGFMPDLAVTVFRGIEPFVCSRGKVNQANMPPTVFAKLPFVAVEGWAQVVNGRSLLGGSLPLVGNGDVEASEKKVDNLWLALSCQFLFISGVRAGAPRAFVDLTRVVRDDRAMQNDTSRLRLIGSEGNGVDPVRTRGVLDVDSAILVVVLAQDARWQELVVPFIEMRGPLVSELHKHMPSQASTQCGTKHDEIRSRGIGAAARGGA